MAENGHYLGVVVVKTPNIKKSFGKIINFYVINETTTIIPGEIQLEMQNIYNDMVKDTQYLGHKSISQYIALMSAL